MGRRKKDEEDLLITVGSRIPKQLDQEIARIGKKERTTKSRMLARLIDYGLVMYRQMNHNRPKIASVELSQIVNKNT